MSQGKVLCLDIGAKRVGVALSDATGSLASPLDVLPSQNPDKLIIDIAGLVAEFEVVTVVVGYPLSLSGRRGPQARLTDKFIAKLRAALPGQSIVSWDERFSTVSARQAMKEAEAGLPRGARVDQYAAAIILQSYLDWKKKGGRDDEVG